MIKKWLKRTGIAILAVLVAGAALAAHEWYADKPFFFRAYLDRQMLKLAFESPETLTSLGFLESMGISGHNADLDDAHPDRTDEFFQDMSDFRDGLLQYEDEDLDAGQLMSKEIVLYLLDLLKEAEPFRHHTYPANQMSGIQSAFPSFMQSMHQVNSTKDARHYVSRLNQIKRKHEQHLLDLKIREEKSIIPPRFVIERILDEMQAFVDTPAKESILYTSLAEKMSEAEGITDGDSTAILDDAEAAINGTVYPAYELFIEYFTGLREQAGDDHGYWHLPGGDKAYTLALKLFTTTDYTPQELHDLGLSEVDRIQGEIISILELEGIDASRGFQAAITEFTERQEFYYPDTDEGREKILEDYQAILDEIDAGLDKAFNIRPEAGVEVVRVPEFRQKTAPGAYYQQPSIDGSRPGRFFANLYDIKATPRFGMRTLAYHEGIPGHHFQVAIAMELEGMPLIRRFSPFTAYVEGWALYAEQLAWEQGFQMNPADNVGRLVGELLRAVRLVVDTGIHYKRWTREEAIEYMLVNTGITESDVVAEIERYIVLPGQATAYKVGMIKILALRQRAMDALGADFDIREFHDVVLKNGAVPLDLLERIVDDWIASQS
jgi:uncharacterized protein (DUF885 family)